MSPAPDHVEGDLGMPRQVDVVVIGGGIIGCASALELAQKGLRVALCEKGRIAGEQSSRNWGFCRQQGRDPAELPLIVESMRRWRRMSETLGEDIGYRPTGCLYVADDDAQEADFRAWLEHAQIHQLDSRMIGRAEIDDLVPGANGRFSRALYTASDGRAEPTRAAPAMARAAQRMGVHILTNCAVRGLDFHAGQVASVVTERGVIAARAVVGAGGVWSELFCARHGLDLPQVETESSVMRTGPAPEVFAGALWTRGFACRRRLDGGYTIANGGSSLCPLTPRNFRHMGKFWKNYKKERKRLRLSLGKRFFEDMATPRDWPLHGPSPFEKTRVLDPQPYTPILDDALANIQAAFPELNDVEIVERWAGRIDVTPDAVPVIGPTPDVPGFYVASGFSGHGFGIGPGAGRLVADLVTGDHPIVDPTPFRFERFH
ncbi:MAG: FAD-binding oxidoreductase [Pseudomonadota bacterium]|nr:FAD-binding oxidoreductase [Pseudomonadota bacterium]